MSHAIIGFGAVGQALTKTFARADLPVIVAGCRAPEALTEAARAIGPRVKSQPLAQALQAADRSAPHRPPCLYID